MKYISMFILLLFTSCNTSEDDKISIAILTPVTHPSLEENESGFKKTMNEKNPGKYRFETYNAQGNKILLRSEIEEIARQEYSLVLTIGTSTSQMIKEVFEKKKLKTPVVFTCVNDPEGYNIVSPNITGVKEMLQFDEEIAALLYYKPDIKNILLIYNPAEPGLQKDQQAVEQILLDRGIYLRTIEVFQTNEMLSKVSPFMSMADAIIILKDNTVVSGLDVIIKLCNLHKIPLMASDLDSPKRGAAFGYGVYEIEFGIEAAKKALKIIDDGISPEMIPVTPISGFILKVNSEAAILQGIENL
jgi:putative tryptophan/tyrosine transport system substrate-binding protein